MTITNGYTDLTTMKSPDVLKLSATDTTSDTILETIIEAASRTIDSDCARFFYKSATDETRYYTAELSDKLFLSDDLVSITELATDGDNDRTWAEIWSATADYDLVPYNAAAIGDPYTAIEMIDTGAYTFPHYRKGVKITGVFGYPAVPKKITQACILLSSRLFKRLSTPLGVASMAAMGEVQISIKDKDPDYWHLIREFMRKV
jgi:hypothetical protein